MKIYFDGVIFSWKRYGGVYRYFQEIVSYVRKNGIQYEIYLHSPFIKSEFLEHTNNHTSVISNHCSINKYWPIKKFFFMLSRIFAEIYFSKIRSGVFHSTYYSTYKNVKIPQVLTLHDLTHEKFPHYFSSAGSKRFIRNKQRCIESANAIICVSQSTKNSLLEHYPIASNKKIHVIYHGLSRSFIEHSENNTPNIDTPKNYFLFVGHRNLYKNFTFMVTAFSKWGSHKNYKILCAGGGCFSPSELNLFRSLGLQDHIVQLNEISDSVLAMLYENSEAFIFPSLDEGFGLPIIEAISCKANVLASDIPVFKEIGEDMIKYFDPRNTDSLVFALESCVSSKVNSETLEFRSEIVKNKYRWEKCAQETVDVYNQTTNEKNLKKDN